MKASMKSSKARGTISGHVPATAEQQSTEASAVSSTANTVLARPPVSRVILKNLPPAADERRIRERFAQFGLVTDCRLLFTKEGRSRQIAFLGFRSADEAAKCVKGSHRTFFDTYKLNVDFADTIGSTEHRPWSKYSTGSTAYKKANPEGAAAYKKANPEGAKKSSRALAGIRDLAGRGGKTAEAAAPKDQSGPVPDTDSSAKKKIQRKKGDKSSAEGDKEDHCSAEEPDSKRRKVAEDEEVDVDMSYFQNLQCADIDDIDELDVVSGGPATNSGPTPPAAPTTSPSTSAENPHDSPPSSRDAVQHCEEEDAAAGTEDASVVSRPSLSIEVRPKKEPV